MSAFPRSMRLNQPETLLMRNGFLDEQVVFQRVIQRPAKYKVQKILIYSGHILSLIMVVIDYSSAGMTKFIRLSFLNRLIAI